MAYYSNYYEQLDPIYQNHLYNYSYSSSSYEYNDVVSFSYNYHQPTFNSYYDSTLVTDHPKYIEHDAVNEYSLAYRGEFNEPDFPEYDPTPYGGGYDITQHYGKSLPPSSDICYPRSSDNSTSKDDMTRPPPLNKEEIVKSSEEPKLTTINEEAESQEASDGNVTDDHDVDEMELKPNMNIPNDESFEHEKTVPRAPPGYYGLGSMDFSQSVYDYWPCLNRDRKQNGYNDYQQEANPWEGAADYLFGSSYPYSERRDAAGSFESVIYGYERHYQQESLTYEQPVYGEDSWEGFSWGVLEVKNSWVETKMSVRASSSEVKKATHKVPTAEFIIGAQWFKRVIRAL
ncbi:hypothetical protein ACFE04_020484 [Oxalis oulophora]